ncbi:MAG: hypothetical protein WBX22_12625 [Silvibacterium sp.]
MMPLLEVIQSRQITAMVRFDETTATLVDQYAAFIHATADDVVNKALNYVFAKDRDFQDYLKSSDSRYVIPTLRIRRTGVPGEPRSKPVTKPLAGVESIESARGVKP